MASRYAMVLPLEFVSTAVGATPLALTGATATAALVSHTATNVPRTLVLVMQASNRSVPKPARVTNTLGPCVDSDVTTDTATNVPRTPVLVTETHSKLAPKPAPATSTTTPLVLMDAPMDTATLVPLVVTSAMAQPLSNA